MALNIYFDETPIDDKRIMSLTKTSQLFENEFSLGATLCNSYSLKIKKGDSLEEPTKVYLRDDNFTLLQTLYVDEIDTEDEFSNNYSLTDGMVRFNQYYDWSNIVNPTVQLVLNAMCLSILGTVAPTVDYIGGMAFPYTDGVTCREFISYIAEILGGYAKINANNELVFVLQKQTPSKTIDIAKCKDIKIGTYFNFDRVVLNNGVDTVKYPPDSSYTGTGDTLYVNPDNILITDSEDFTMSGIIEHIYNLVNGLSFYNIKTTRCQFDDTIEAGDMISFILDSNTYNTIAQYQWDYNCEWAGGFELDVENNLQNETQVIDDTEKLRRLSIKVDKQNGEIEQEIASTNGNVTKIIQDANSLTGYFSSASGARYIKMSSDGIKVSKNPDSDDYGSVNITDDGVYIKDDSNTVVAQMKSNEFDTTNWVYSETRNGNCLNIYKRRV